MTAPSFRIGHRWVGQEHDPLIIAEIGINHGGDLGEAIKLADAAIDAGAEVVKHQTHVIDDEMSDHAKHVTPGNADRSIYEIMNEAALNESEEGRLMEHVVSRGAVFISTPFSRAAADRLASLDVPAFKVGSGECNNYPLLKHIADVGKPVILSTGMNDIPDIARAVAILRTAGVPYALLHCTNVYPTADRLVRLGAMQELAREFPDAVVGLSDHTVDNLACIAAMALGAGIVERHFTDVKYRPGPDISCSMVPEELFQLKEASRRLQLMRGGRKGLVEEERTTTEFAFASVCTIADVERGDPLTRENIWVKRPGNGDFLAAEFESLLGRRATRALRRGHQLRRSDVEDYS